MARTVLRVREAPGSNFRRLTSLGTMWQMTNEMCSHLEDDRVRTLRHRRMDARTVCGSEASGCTCADACHAGTSVAATTRPRDTPPRTSTQSAHPIIQSFEPGEDWLWCYVDEVGFEIPELIPSPSHP